ncbi:MAG: hypothetical protein U0232_13925 [Thermomicrobiales bacterium]
MRASRPTTSPSAARGLAGRGGERDRAPERREAADEGADGGGLADAGAAGQDEEAVHGGGADGGALFIREFLGRRCRRPASDPQRRGRAGRDEMRGCASGWRGTLFGADEAAAQADAGTVIDRRAGAAGS